MARVLSRRGAIYLHCDDTACHHLRLLMDGAFGAAAYRNMITWQRSAGKCDAKRSFGRISDIIFHYARDGAVFNPQFTPLKAEYIAKSYRHDDGDGRGLYRLSDLGNPRPGGYAYQWKGYAPPAKGWSCPMATMERYHSQGRLHYPKKSDGRVQFKRYLADSNGTPVGNIWSDIGMTQRPDYPTQKPVALLERIIAASSISGDLVFDPFMGSGTTLVAARRLGRRYAGCDVSPDAVAATRDRLEAEPDTLFDGGAC